VIEPVVTVKWQRATREDRGERLLIVLFGRASMAEAEMRSGTSDSAAGGPDAEAHQGCV
jgi:hypothetical protein